MLKFQRDDASGQRLTSVTKVGAQTTTTYDYSGTTLLGLSAVRTDGANWKIRYLYDDAGRPFSGVYLSDTTSATPFAVETSDRGDVRELLASNGGAFVRYSYDAYGVANNTITGAAGGLTTAQAAEIAGRQPLRYAGYVYDGESGLYYCSQRYYDPTVAAFISKDPARADGSESPYQYCAGDPIGATDPSGLGLRLTIWSKQDSAAALDFGHSWLTVGYTGPKRKYTVGRLKVLRGYTESLGLSPGPSHPGIWYNREVRDPGSYVGSVSLGMAIGWKDLAKINSFIRGKDVYTGRYNCANFAADAWNLLHRKVVRPQMKGEPVGDPFALKKSIQRRAGYQVNSQIAQGLKVSAKHAGYFNWRRRWVHAAL